MHSNSLTITEEGVFFAGKPFRIISGSVHYFRIHPSCWRGRLELAKRFGLNTIMTYVPWNLHEAEDGVWSYDGMLNLSGFLDLAHELGLHVLLRPSPFINSECDFGGLPWWLMKDPHMQLRTLHPQFMAYVRRHYQRLCREIVPRLATNGGPIIAVCIENEYGGYSNDSEYMAELLAVLAGEGVDVPFFTTDGANSDMLRNGSLPGVWEGVNFRRGARESLALLRRQQPALPLFVGEYWSGRQTHWGEENNPRDVAEVAAVLDDILSSGAHINFYMFSGGTSFGFFSGANYLTGRYDPLITSYDVDALVSEWGKPTAKYYACQRVLARHLGLPVMEPLPEIQSARAYDPLILDECQSLFSVLETLSVPVSSRFPMTMEALGQGYGFILYSTCINSPLERRRLYIDGLRDRATIYINGQYAATCMREREDSAPVWLETASVAGEKTQIRILVENTGRQVSSPQLRDWKGILKGVRMDTILIADWAQYALPLDDLSRLQFNSQMIPKGQPAFYRGCLRVDVPADTFLYLPGWHKGYAWINGFNLGRYWKIGPQQTLYIPGALLHRGENELIVFEIHSPSADRRVELLDHPILHERNVE